MSPKPKMHEVVVIMRASQIKHLQKAYPNEWSFTRRLLTWYLGHNPPPADKGIPVKEILVWEDEAQVIPEDESEASSFYLH